MAEIRNHLNTIVQTLTRQKLEWGHQVWGRERLRQLIREGKLEIVGSPRRPLIPWSAMEKLLEESTRSLTRGSDV